MEFTEVNTDLIGKAQRGNREIENDADGSLLFLRMKEGHIFYSSKSGDKVISKGDLCLFSDRTECEIEVSDRFSVQTIHVQRDLAKRITNIDEILPGPLFSKKDLSSNIILDSHIRTMFEQLQNITARELTSLSGPTIELIAQAFQISRSNKSTKRGKINVSDIKMHILTNLKDYELTLGAIAEAHGITIRYLHMLFEEEQSSISSWIKNQRLENCYRDLEQAKLTGKSITDIALDWGFNDLSYFSRSFKKRFSQSPRAILNNLNQ